MARKPWVEKKYMTKEPKLSHYLVGEKLDLIFCEIKEVEPVIEMAKRKASLEEIQESLNRPAWEVLYLLLDLAHQQKIKRLIIDIDLNDEEI